MSPCVSGERVGVRGYLEPASIVRASSCIFSRSISQLAAKHPELLGLLRLSAPGLPEKLGHCVQRFHRMIRTARTNQFIGLA
jgi:hypothetical protein